MFSDKEGEANYDGVRVKVTQNIVQNQVWDGSFKFEVDDLWTPLKFAVADQVVDKAASDWKLVSDNGQDENACDEKSICMFKATVMRSFSTSDANDLQFEHGKFLGYELYGFYEMTNDNANVQALTGKTQKLNLLMGAYCNSAAVLAVISAYAAMAF